jgi:nucleoside-triphosphatase THEP1
MLPGGETVCLVSDPDARGAGCRLDAGRLAELAKRLAAAMQNGADLVIINRFGPAEAEGGGLNDLIAQALDADIPVLIAVPERRFLD